MEMLPIEEIKCMTNSLVKRWANHIAGFYGHPVYLVGSQLTSKDPRDVDVICIIPDNEFVLRYINQQEVVGHSDVEKCQQWYLRWLTGLYDASNWTWCRDVSHKSLQGMDFCSQQIDMKVLSDTMQEEYYSDKMKLKISSDKPNL